MPLVFALFWILAGVLMIFMIVALVFFIVMFIKMGWNALRGQGPE
jgi:hypothetical protein